MHECLMNIFLLKDDTVLWLFHTNQLSKISSNHVLEVYGLKQCKETKYGIKVTPQE